MKYLLFLSSILLGWNNIAAQNIKDANVYVSNLEENMWFNSYDDKTKTIKGVHFLVLSDGDNSQDVTPEFKIKLYLYQKDKEPLFIKTITQKGIYHMGSKEYKNLTISLKDFEITEGVYRLGVFVDADDEIKEDSGDNAMLFKGELKISAGSAVSDEEKPKKTEDDSGEW